MRNDITRCDGAVNYSLCNQLTFDKVNLGFAVSAIWTGKGCYCFGNFNNSTLTTQ